MKTSTFLILLLAFQTANGQLKQNLQLSFTGGISERLLKINNRDKLPSDYNLSNENNKIVPAYASQVGAEYSLHHSSGLGLSCGVHYTQSSSKILNDKYDWYSRFQFKDYGKLRSTKDIYELSSIGIPIRISYMILKDQTWNLIGHIGLKGDYTLRVREKEMLFFENVNSIRNWNIKLDDFERFVIKACLIFDARYNISEVVAIHLGLNVERSLSSDFKDDAALKQTWYSVGTRLGIARKW